MVAQYNRRVHRRDFLLLRHPSAPRMVQISCERLHMAYLDLQSASASAPGSDGFSFAEPPAVVPARTLDEWFGDLERDLAGVEVIQLLGAEWLHPDALRRQVDELLRRLSQRGVRVEDAGWG